MKKILIAVSVLMLAGMSAGILLYDNETEWLSEEAEENETALPSSTGLRPAAPGKVSYSLQNEALHLTFDEGGEWVKVPFSDIKALFRGEYEGDEGELIEGSYFLSEHLAAFLYVEDEADRSSQNILLKYTTDQGENWQDSLVAESLPPIRFRKVSFLDADFGYIILSSGRVMGQESSLVFLTKDGGENWQETASAGITNLLYDGGFLDEDLGFLSHGTINPEEPILSVTQDGGDSWEKAEIAVPEEYQKIFVTAEVPYEEGDQLALLLNQGPAGDYKGGLVKGKFVSLDNGSSWEFEKEVEADETE